MRYTQLYRPPSSCALPKGWTLVERPFEGFEKRIDLPLSEYRFGIVEFERMLTADEIEDFELKLITGKCPKCGTVGEHYCPADIARE